MFRASGLALDVAAKRPLCVNISTVRYYRVRRQTPRSEALEEAMEDALATVQPDDQHAAMQA